MCYSLTIITICLLVMLLNIHATVLFFFFFSNGLMLFPMAFHISYKYDGKRLELILLSSADDLGWIDLI